MSDKVHKLRPVEVGEGYRFDPDEILEAAKGKAFERVVILGELPDGTLWISGSANLGESIVLIELAKHDLLFGGDE